MGGAKVEIGSYVGTGTGSKNSIDQPATLSFDFAPKYLQIFYSGGGMVYVIDTSARQLLWSVCLLGLSSEKYILALPCYDHNIYMKKSSDGKTLYWYDATATSTAGMANNSNTTYHYMAIG